MGQGNGRWALEAMQFHIVSFQLYILSFSFDSSSYFFNPSSSFTPSFLFLHYLSSFILNQFPSSSSSSPPPFSLLIKPAFIFRPSQFSLVFSAYPSSFLILSLLSLFILPLSPFFNFLLSNVSLPSFLLFYRLSILFILCNSSFSLFYTPSSFLSLHFLSLVFLFLS